MVTLPHIPHPPMRGNLRTRAVQRYISNEHSLGKKDKLEQFNDVLSEYITLDHAEKVPASEVSHHPSYYLPVHGVFEDASMTTEVRAIFDTSAKANNGVALNSILETGPNLHPLLTDMLIGFCSHQIGLTADISKMFREICSTTLRKIYTTLWCGLAD